MRPLLVSLAALALSATALAACAPVEGDSDDAASTDSAVKVKNVTKADRQKYLATASIWRNDPSEKDLLVGPTGKGSFPAVRTKDGGVTFPSLTCKFVEPKKEHELGGKSPKFQCGACEDGCTTNDTLKVKFGKDADANGELYAEVMATRLFWALGLATDDVYPVIVTCKNCPEDPWAIYDKFQPGKGARADRTFTAALIERKYEGAKIEESNWPENKDSQGFGFDEVDEARRKMPGRGAPTVEWAAFELLAAFIQHADNKAANQRLVCAPDAVTPDATCSAAILMMQDVGATFGGGAGLFGTIGDGAKSRLGKWQGEHLWKDRRSCTAGLFSRFTLIDPQVSDAGRAFLSERMKKLTDAQLRDIFTASRIVERGEKVDGRPATVEDWVKAFRAKLAELDQSCGH